MEGTIISYGIAAAEDHFQLAEMVNDQIRAGWQPYQSSYQINHGQQVLLMQALVKYKKIRKTRTDEK